MILITMVDNDYIMLYWLISMVVSMVNINIPLAIPLGFHRPRLTTIDDISEGFP